jgi:hypothetical protein
MTSGQNVKRPDFNSYRVRGVAPDGNLANDLKAGHHFSQDAI